MFRDTTYNFQLHIKPVLNLPIESYFLILFRKWLNSPNYYQIYF